MVTLVTGVAFCQVTKEEVGSPTSGKIKKNFPFSLIRLYLENPPHSVDAVRYVSIDGGGLEGGYLKW